MKQLDHNLVVHYTLYSEVLWQVLIIKVHSISARALLIF